MEVIKDKFKKYGESAKGNFSIKDSIGVPHPYCITPKHLSVGRIILDGDAIREAENKGVVCDICKTLVKEGKQDKILSFDEHKQGLLVECKLNIKEGEKELHEWLLKIKDMAVKDKYEGFLFVEYV